MTTILYVSNNLDKGNHQAHPENKEAPNGVANGTSLAAAVDEVLVPVTEDLADSTIPTGVFAEPVSVRGDIIVSSNRKAVSTARIARRKAAVERVFADLVSQLDESTEETGVFGNALNSALGRRHR